MNAHTSPRFFLLPADGQEEPASEELRERIALAFADDQIRSLAKKTAFRFGELARKAALDHFVLQAIEAADPAAGNAGILQVLEETFAELSTELDQWNTAAKVAEGRAKQRSARVTPLLCRAGNARMRRENEVFRLRQDINAARIAGLQPSEKHKKYRAAGLTTEQIAKIGDAGPTLDYVEKMEWQIKVLEGEIKRLDAFQRDPLHRLSNLQGLELTAADDYPVGRIEPHAMHRPAA